MDMTLDRQFSLDSFLPLDRMAQSTGELRASYVAAKPFPHFVVDNFFDPALLEQVLAEFPRPGQIDWHIFNNDKEIKLAENRETSFGPATRLLLYHLNSMTFLDFLSAVTGIPDLIPDPTFTGGGLHQIIPGGKLGVHTDFNRHDRYGLDRRVNALVYLNKDWKEEFGGHLELWNRDVTECGARILPIFNRLAVFGTNDFTYHGHPHPLQCPEGMTRKSLALYYYSNGRPREEIKGDHTTVFKDTPEEKKRRTPRARIARITRELVPPIIYRWFQGG
jgi:hypothetical protein